MKKAPFGQQTVQSTFAKTVMYRRPLANQFITAKMRLKTVCVVLLILSYVALRGCLAKDLEDRGGQNHRLMKVCLSQQ